MAWFRRLARFCPRRGLPIKSNPFPPMSVHRDINGIAHAYLAGIGLIDQTSKFDSCACPVGPVAELEDYAFVTMDSHGE